MGFLGYTFLIATQTKDDSNNILYCKRSGCDASGTYKDGIFTVFKGSKIRVDDKYTELENDKIFQTPSGASRYVVGMSSNGWIDWKSSEGKTMDEIFRRVK